MSPTPVQDQNLIVADPLPHPLQAPGSLTAYSRRLDLFGVAAVGQNSFVPLEYHLALLVPALDAVTLPDGKTLTYSLEMADAANETDFTSAPVTLVSGCIVQTGAGGIGAAAASYEMRVGYEINRRFCRVKVVGSAGIGDCSGRKMVFELLRG
jgi:hypothetical protein